MVAPVGQTPAMDILIESRSGGKHFDWYLERDVWADAGTKIKIAPRVPMEGDRWVPIMREPDLEAAGCAKRASKTPPWLHHGQI